MTILLVDDSATQRLALTKILKEACGTAVLQAASSVDALRYLEQNGEIIDLIMSDLNMPDLNGIEFCQKVKANPDWADIPFIMVTHSINSDDLEMAFAAGALDYITKPPNRVEMKARVLSALKLKHETDRRKIREQELFEEKEHSLAASHAKSAFLANMSHELRTPLNAILGYGDLLLQGVYGPVTDRQQDRLARILENGRHLLGLINDVLDLSKIEAEKLELIYETFDVEDCVVSALRLVEARGIEKNLKLHYDIDDSTPTSIIGDEVRLRQILVNLIGNAIKFTTQGEVCVDVQATQIDSAEMNTYELRFAVHDTGMGISSDRIDRLFKPFSQGDSSVTREFGGTGLGLAISKRLAEMMGGTMWVESEGIPGQGSTFYFTILARTETASVINH
jgi:signal transduction histidine kinase